MTDVLQKIRVGLLRANGFLSREGTMPARVKIRDVAFTLFD